MTSPRVLDRRWWAYALIAAAVCYLTWVFDEAVNPALDPLRSYVSEYAADDQPGAWFFRIGDVLTGTLAGAAAVMFAKRASDIVVKAAWWSVVVFGVATLLDAGPFTLTCAPSIDATCRAAEQAGTLPVPDQVHSVASVLSAAAILVAAFGFAVTSRAPLMWGLAVLLALATAATLIAVLGDTDVGVVQRLQLLLTSVWLTALGWRWRTS
ncbi:hypothetical protein Afil01_03610 [Actinorhabdospora filicis]|uniref:DUF998 domain-containing protein n=1 Tax=Actinorhabdospora filicis TaxID=1785913 RepID=A0A9W6SE49_9ACTN|nr:DUF998 domain-containing protein [Actinorhabdospora filicis]GLZ75554.1 hypothetical protein Afil01_03610 [Actinorhabdospora filicis]